MPITSASLDRLPHSIYEIEWYSVIRDFSNDVHRGVWGVQLLDAEQCQEKLRFAR